MFVCLENFSQNGSAIFQSEAREKNLDWPMLKDSGNDFFEKLCALEKELEFAGKVKGRGGIEEIPFAVPIKIFANFTKLQAFEN